jgi:hypothetical protein
LVNEADQTSLEQAEELSRAVETLRAFCGIVLLSFAKHGQDLRDTVARNFVARGMGSTQSIYTVWKSGHEQDAWILHRSLLDRLFHLHHLGATDEFEAFEEYSFISMYKARQQLISDPAMKDKVPSSLKELQEVSRQRYDTLAGKKPRWRRPKAEDIARSMDLGFLYRFGYDYASTHVHPMIDDGEADVAALIAAPGAVQQPDSTVLKNSILVQSLLVQEAFNVSGLRWRAIAYDFLGQIRAFVGMENPGYQVTFLKIGRAWPEMELCEPMAGRKNT